MAKFRNKPKVIEAVQFTGDIGAPEIVALDLPSENYPEMGGDVLLIRTIEGTMIAQRGDWIITGIEGERYPCKPDIFAKSYERID